MTHHADPWIVHLAGAPVGAVQYCDGCGHILQDNTDWYEGRVMVPIDQADRGPAWFPIGERIAVLDNCSVSLPAERPLEDDERLCGGAN